MAHVVTNRLVFRTRMDKADKEEVNYPKWMYDFYPWLILVGVTIGFILYFIMIVKQII